MFFKQPCGTHMNILLATPCINLKIILIFVLQDLEKEYQRQAYFQSKMPDGEITAVKFSEIMKVLRGHKLSPFVREYLLTVRTGSVSFFVSQIR